VLQSPDALWTELMLPAVKGTNGASVGRLAGLDMAWKNVSASPITFLFGYGPAAAQGSRFDDLRSDLAGELALQGGLASQITRSLYEWGLLGLIAYVLILAAIVKNADDCLTGETDPFWRALALGESLLALLMIGTSFYTAPWSATSVSFLVWAGWAIVKWHFHQKNLPLKSAV
jgi:hypothetical protein